LLAYTPTKRGLVKRPLFFRVDPVDHLDAASLSAGSYAKQIVTQHPI